MTAQRFYLKMAMSSLIRRRSRMLVALLAVAVGATILSGLSTIYYDIPRQLGQEFRSYGANMVLLPGEGGEFLTPEQAGRAVSFFPEEDLIGAAPYRYHTVKVNEQPFMAAGTSLEEAKKTSPYWFIRGNWPSSPGEALIGQEVADRVALAPGSVFTITGTNALGEPIHSAIPGSNLSGGVERKVSGILQSGGAEEAFIIMSFSDFEEMMAEGGKIDTVECSVSAPSDALTALAETIGAAVPGLEAHLVKRVTESEGTVLAKLKALIYIVTAIVLLLIMICVATTMMAVVAERRKEIGLKKALGAGEGRLAFEFLGEGIILGAGGGVLGAVFGFVFAWEVSVSVFSRAVSFRPLFVLVTLAGSVLVTALSCLLPVRSAAEVDPAVVLRGE
ncbi:MAG: FtsX-like permease family protein [Spirochaetaceae bacterium]|jgi:putative ABC transport system permease protein|nr:FtsX-like permease family protein [Spirochaetaceae bacterium]